MLPRTRIVSTLLLLGTLVPAASAADEAPSNPGAVAASSLAESVFSERGPEIYQVGPGDILTVRVYGQDEFNDDYLVDEAGMLDLPWVGRLQIGGLGVSEINRVVETTLADGYLRDPQVTVQVKTYASQPVQLLGAVKKPDTYYLQGPTNLLELIAMAGGVENDKASSEVRVTRAIDGVPHGISVSLEDLMNTGAGNVQIKRGDVVNILEGKVFYVNGEVGKPGDYAWKGGITVTRALAMAGSGKSSANLRKVTLIRSSGEKLTLNVSRIVKGKDPDVVVMAGDQVVVGESAF